jgi:hypothetical protein
MPSRRVDRSLAAGRIGENDDCHIILHPKSLTEKEWSDSSPL